MPILIELLQKEKNRDLKYRALRALEGSADERSLPALMRIIQRDEDANMRMLAVRDADGSLTARQMVIYTLALIVTSLLPHRLGMAGDLYVILAICLGLFFLAPVVVASLRRDDAGMRGVFLASLAYLPLLFVVMLIDKR